LLYILDLNKLDTKKTIKTQSLRITSFHFNLRVFCIVIIENCGISAHISTLLADIPIEKNITYNDLHDIIHRAAAELCNMTKVRPVDKPYNKKWFDSDCMRLRNKLEQRHKLKNAKLKGWTEDRESEYAQLKAEYKLLRKEKKQVHFNKLQNDLSNVKTTNNSGLLSKASGQPLDSQILYPMQTGLLFMTP
jgi:hypothetical protein